MVQNGFKIWHLQINYLKNLCSFLLFFFISLCRIVNENFRIHSIKHIDNCRRCLILLIVPQDFLFEDNCNSSKNPSSEIHNYIPKIFLFKISYFCFYFIFLFIFICLWKSWKIIIKPHAIPKWCIKIKILEKRYRNNSYQIRIEMMVSLCQILFSANFIKQKELAKNKQCK